MDILNSIIGDRIREELELQHQKQNDLAEYLGVSKTVVSYFVNGKRRPNLEQLMAISGFLKVPVDYLLGISNVKADDMTLKGVCNYTNLSEQTIKKISTVSEAQILFLDIIIQNIASPKFLTKVIRHSLNRLFCFELEWCYAEKLIEKNLLRDDYTDLDIVDYDKSYMEFMNEEFIYTQSYSDLHEAFSKMLQEENSQFANSYSSINAEYEALALHNYIITVAKDLYYKMSDYLYEMLPEELTEMKELEIKRRYEKKKVNNNGNGTKER